MNLIKKRWGFMPIVDLKKEKKREKERKKKKMDPPLSESLTRFTIRGYLVTWDIVPIHVRVWC